MTTIRNKANIEEISKSVKSLVWDPKKTPRRIISSAKKNDEKKLSDNYLLLRQKSNLLAQKASLKKEVIKYKLIEPLIDERLSAKKNKENKSKKKLTSALKSKSKIKKNDTCSNNFNEDLDRPQSKPKNLFNDFNNNFSHNLTSKKKFGRPTNMNIIDNLETNMNFSSNSKTVNKNDNLQMSVNKIIMTGQAKLGTFYSASKKKPNFAKASLKQSSKRKHEDFTQSDEEFVKAPTTKKKKINFR